MLPDIIRYKIQRALFALAGNHFPKSRYADQIVSGPHGYMDVAVDNTGHNEFTVEIFHLSVICRKSVLIANIDELSVLHNKRAGQRFFLIRSKDDCVFDDPVRFHFSLSYSILYNIYSLTER